MNWERGRVGLLSLMFVACYGEDRMWPTDPSADAAQPGEVEQPGESGQTSTGSTQSGSDLSGALESTATSGGVTSAVDDEQLTKTASEWPASSDDGADVSVDFSTQADASVDLSAARDASPDGQGMPWVFGDETGLGLDSGSSTAAVFDGGVYDVDVRANLSDAALAIDASVFTDAATDAGVDAPVVPPCLSDEACTVPDDPCWNARCNAGTCTIVPAAEGTTCGQGATPCSAQDSCDGTGECLPNHIPSDGDVEVNGQIPGDCLVKRCDGQGGVLEAAQDSDLPRASPGECLRYVCSEGVVETADLVTGTSCGSGFCFEGACVQCTADEQCPSASCRVSRCTNNQCEPEQVAAAGTECDDGYFCTIDDACSSDGRCTGEARSCSGGCNEGAEACCTRDGELIDTACSGEHQAVAEAALDACAQAGCTIGARALEDGCAEYYCAGFASP